MWTLTDNLEWESLRDQFSWLKDMEQVPQDPVFHAEGNVAIHTQMVLKSLQELEEFEACPEQEQAILIAAALLHDIEKRSTTQIDPDGRVRSPGHAKKGALTARAILFEDLPTPFKLREQIAGLVRYHGFPLCVFEKEAPIRSLLKVALEVNTRLLYILAKADAIGRICPDQRDLLYKIELFKALCQEQNCWGQGFIFGSDLGKYQYLQEEKESPHYTPFESNNFEVVLMSGLPGMGKDHFIEKHYKDWPIVSLDAIRRRYKIKPGHKKRTGWVIQEARAQAKEYLRKQIPFIWNATNLSVDLRRKQIQLFQTYGAKSKILYIEKDFQTWRSQNKNREFVVPDAILKRMLTKWDVPKLWEAPLVEYAVPE